MSSEDDHNNSKREAQPEFRFAQLHTRREEEHAATLPVASTQKHAVIDREAVFREEAPSSSNNNNLWRPTELQPPPAFYHLEKSTRLVSDCPASELADRVQDCLRRLSVQAVYANTTAALYTAEHVEMHLSLWNAQTGILVELQRRKGDSVAFHRYARSILDAVVLGETPDALTEKQHSRRVQRLLLPNTKSEVENCLVALEIAHGLLRKDRMDAQRLGLESLCLLTDAAVTGPLTAVLASHVVLLGHTAGATEEVEEGGPFTEIRRIILMWVLGEHGEGEEEEEDAEHGALLHNLALAVLANALDVMEHAEARLAEQEDNDDDEERKPRSRLRTSSSNDVAQEFVKKDSMLPKLIAELGKASQQPHNATLSAQCLGSLCRASEEARRKAHDLGAKQVVRTALEVGTRTHLQLELEAKMLEEALVEEQQQQQE